MNYTYTTVRSNRKSIALQITPDGSLIIRAPFKTTEAYIDEFVQSKSPWIEMHLKKLNDAKQRQGSAQKLTNAEIQELADRAVKYIPQRVEHYAKLIGVDYGRITIRMQKTKWGSCSQQGNLNFNCLLMLTPPEVIDSVVVHELCHRKEMNHSNRFYSEILKVFPEYHKWNKWLKENGNALMARAF